MASFLNEIYDIVSFWAYNLKTNIYLSFINVPLKHYVRLVAIIGAYLLLRPYLIKLGARAQRREHEKVNTPADSVPAKISPNSLRGRVEVPDGDSEVEGTAKDEGDVKWGKKARKRQRQVVKKLLEQEEQRLKELEDEEEDKGLEEFLMRYGATGREVVL